MTDGVARGPGQQQRRAEIGVAFECRVCGRPVLLVAESGAVVVPNRALFLEMHRACLDELRRQGDPPD